jgi:hypothetical protein
MIVLRKVGLVLLGLWAVLSVGALGQFLLDVAATSDRWLISELEVKLSLETAVLNFPASLVAALLSPSTAGPVAQWCLFTLAGLFQWVLVLPAAVRWLWPLVRRRVGRSSGRVGI